MTCFTTRHIQRGRGGVRATFFNSEGAKINDSLGPPSVRPPGYAPGMYAVCMLYTSSKCINTVVNEWLKDNKLSLNVSTSEAMIMGTRHKVSNIDRNDVNVNVNGLRLQYVNACKHLGVVINDKLTWHDQINKVRNQVLFGSYMLRKATYFIPSHTL